MIIVKTPLRVSFFGGGTDFPEYFNSSEGMVIGSTIDKFIYHTVSKYSKSLFENSIRFSYSKIEYAKTLSSIQHEPFKKILNLMNCEKEIEVNLASDLPSFSGMGSSSSFSVGLINGLNSFLKNKTLSKKELATKAIFIEREVLKEWVGFQDQAFAAYGGFNSITFKDNRFSVKKIKIKKERKKIFNECLFLVYTGIKRKAHDLEKIKFENLNALKIKYLDQIYAHALEAKKIFEDDSKSLDSIGYLLNEAWYSKKMLSDSVSSSHIDEIYNKGLKSKASGGKLLGAGGGGFILFYVPVNNIDFFKHSMSKYYILDFMMQDVGSKIIQI